MNIKKINLIFLALSLFCQLKASSSHTILPCTIEFPKAVKTVPQICVRYCGDRFTCETDREGKRACFTLPVDKNCTHFSLLITQSFDYEIAKDNTVQYFTVDPECKYKFYNMELVRAPKKRYRTSGESKKTVQKKDHWIIKEEQLKKDGRLPDDTIIVMLNAEYVDEVTGKNGFELPSIAIKRNVIEIAGSEKKLHENATQLILASLDYNLLHSHCKVHTRQDKQKVIIAMANM